MCHLYLWKYNNLYTYYGDKCTVGYVSDFWGSILNILYIHAAPWCQCLVETHHITQPSSPQSTLSCCHARISAHIFPAVNNLAMTMIVENVLLFFGRKSWDQNYFKISISYKIASEMKTDVWDYSPQINTWYTKKERGSCTSLQSDTVRTQQQCERQMTHQDVFKIGWSHRKQIQPISHFTFSSSFRLLMLKSYPVFKR